VRDLIHKGYRRSASIANTIPQVYRDCAVSAAKISLLALGSYNRWGVFGHIDGNCQTPTGTPGASSNFFDENETPFLL
jgi:hypothetical protein